MELKFFVQFVGDLRLVCEVDLFCIRVDALEDNMVQGIQEWTK